MSRRKKKKTDRGCRSMGAVADEGVGVREGGEEGVPRGVSKKKSAQKKMRISGPELVKKPVLCQKWIEKGIVNYNQ